MLFLYNFIFRIFLLDFFKNQKLFAQKFVKCLFHIYYYYFSQVQKAFEYFRENQSRKFKRKTSKYFCASRESQLRGRERDYFVKFSKDT